jgi:hypothetical protein
MEALEGPAGVLRLCDLNFVNSDFSQETGAFLAGVFTPYAMLQDEETETALEEWFVQRLPQLPPILADRYLSGFRSSGLRLTRCFNNARTGMRQILSDVLLSGPDLLRPHACYLLSACAGPLKQQELEMIFTHPGVKLREQLALGIVAENSELTKTPYWIDEPSRKLKVVLDDFHYVDQEQYGNVNLDLDDDDIPF